MVFCAPGALGCDNGCCSRLDVDVFYISFEVVGKPIDREWFCM